ncbi:MAG: metallophosphoesterase family protein [Phocaeicola sp.]
MKRTYKNWLSAIALIVALASCSQTKSHPKEQTVTTKFSFAFLTDVHLNKENRGNGEEGLRQALAHAKTKGVDFVLFGGDNTDSDGLGRAEQTADSLQARFKQIVDDSSLPAYFTIGNHDRFYLENGQVDSLGFNLFKKRFGETYFSYTHKGVHFVVLNSLYPTAEGAYSINPEQLEWLKADLDRAGTEVPIIVSLHVPMLSLYYPVVEGNFKPLDMIQNTKEVFELLNNYNVQLILQGHQHLYEQIQERNRWFVTAGAVSAYWWGGSFLETEEGYLLIQVDNNNKVSWSYVDYGWQVTEKQTK